MSYILSHGADGLRQVAGDAVLNANYVLRSLEDLLDAPFGASGPCMHEALFSDKGFGGGLSTIDLAKALIDEGYHPMTMYFPLVVHGAMLVEPTETESKAGLDQFIGALRSVAARAKAGDESLKAARPHRGGGSILRRLRPRRCWSAGARGGAGRFMTVIAARAAARNAAPIVGCCAACCPGAGWPEIASGGRACAPFRARNGSAQPSDLAAALRRSRLGGQSELFNLLPALALDLRGEWPVPPPTRYCAST